MRYIVDFNYPNFDLPEFILSKLIQSISNWYTFLNKRPSLILSEHFTLFIVLFNIFGYNAISILYYKLIISDYGCSI